MRRAARLAGWTAAALLALVALLTSVVLVVPNTATGRKWIERWTVQLTAGHVRITDLAGTFPGTIDVGQLELSDAHGVWLSAKHVALRWSPLDLLGWHVHIEQLAIAQLRVVRTPQSKSHGPRATGRARITLPLPHIDVAQMSISEVVLEPAIAGSRTELAVNGSAHLKSLKRATAEVTARRTNGTGVYELKLHFDPRSLNATLKLDEPASGPLEHLVGLPGLGALSVKASLSGPRTAERVRLDAHVGALAATVRGTVNFAHRSGALTYAVDSPAQSPRAGLSWVRLELHGRWRGTLNAPEGASELHVQDLKLPTGLHLAALAMTLHAAKGVLGLRATAAGLVLPRPVSRRLAGSPVRLDATLRLNQPRRPLDLAVHHALVSVTAHAFTRGARSATFAVRVPDVGPFASLARLKLTGPVTAQGRVFQHGAATHLDVSARTNLAGRNLLSRLLGGASRLHLAAHWTARAFDVVDLNLHGGNVSFSSRAQASRSAPGRTWRIDRSHWQANLTNLSSVAASLHGNVSLSGTASGPLQALATQLHAQASFATRGGAHGTLGVRLATRGLTGQLKANGTLDGAPLVLAASVNHRSGQGIRLTLRTASWQSVHLSGDWASGVHGLASGQLHVRIARLADLQPILGRPIKGRLTASAALATRAGRPSARVDINAQNLSTTGSAADVRLSGTGPLAALPLTLAVRLTSLRGHPLNLEAALKADAPARAVQLEQLTAHYRAQTARLLAPARVSFAKELRITPIRLGIGHATVELAGDWAPALDMRATLRGVDARLINAFEPQLLASGTLDASAHLTGTLGAPQGLVSLAVRNVRLGESAARDLPVINLHGTVRLSRRSAQLDARLDAGRDSRFIVRGRVPLAAAEHYALKVSGRIEAALANPLLEAHGEHASGALAVDATVNGPRAHPQIGGTIDIEHGSLRDYANGLQLGDITGHLVGGRGVLRITKLEARAGPGRISVTGTLGVLEPHWPVDLRLTATHAEPVESDFITANVNADVSIRGTLSRRLDVAGNIHVNRAQIGVPKGLPPNVAVLDVRRPGEAPPPAHPHRLTIGLDLTVDAPRAILVQGRGLDAELGGRLRLAGTADAPQVHGGFQMIMGTFSLASTLLRFSSGSVSFNGAGPQHKIDPTLNFTAQATAAGATVTLQVSGFADAPRFALSSTPPLPQDEILARLLFGESASQLTGLQVAEIGAAIASLSGIGGGNSVNPLVRLQKLLGLNRLSVGSAGSGTSQHAGASITAGRYVSNRVFVAATQNTTGTSQLKVDVVLTKHFKLQTRIGNGTATAQGTTPENDPGSSIGLSYQFNY